MTALEYIESTWPNHSCAIVGNCHSDHKEKVLEIVPDARCVKVDRKFGVNSELHPYYFIATGYRKISGSIQSEEIAWKFAHCKLIQEIIRVLSN